MSEEDRLKLENELLLTKSKAQMINLYLDLQQKVEHLENIRKEAIDYILNGRYGEDDDLESISLYMPDLLNILNKGDNKE